MTETLYAHIDEQGRIILPPGLAEGWGLSPGENLRIESNGLGTPIQPAGGCLWAQGLIRCP